MSSDTAPSIDRAAQLKQLRLDALDRAREKLVHVRVEQRRRREEFIAFVLRCNAQGLNDKQIADLISRPHGNINSLMRAEGMRHRLNTRIQLFLLYVQKGLITNELIKTEITRAEILHFTDMNLRNTF